LQAKEVRQRITRILRFIVVEYISNMNYGEGEAMDKVKCGRRGNGGLRCRE
jgi:hypothetical protein